MKKEKEAKKKRVDFLDVILILAPFLTGLLSIWSLALVSIMCLGGVIFFGIKNKKVNLPYGKNLIFLLVYLLSFIVVEFYAIDKGMNILGFFKNLTILLFVILYAQYDNSEEEKKRRLELIPYAACANLLLTFFIMLFPDNGVYFNNRLQGIFGYANSYGLFLLIGITVLANKEKLKWYDFVIFGILVIGIILTNSRAIILMTIFALIVSLFTNKKNIKKISALLIGALVIFGGIYAFSQIEKRVNTEMLGSSEFTSRLLYYSDALNMIKDNPFGYGYEGWYFKQAEVKTGVYDTKYVHNSVLQVLLDVGIVPTIALFALLLFTFFDKKQTALSRLIMILILGHSIIDIDLEYIYFILLIVPFIDFKKYKCGENSICRKIIIAISSLLIIPYFMIFISDANYSAKNYKEAVNIIPFHTEAIQEVLYNVKNKDEQVKYAHEALKYNEIVSGAYEALSNELQEQGKYLDALELEEKRIRYNKYEMRFYMDYAKFLTNAFNYYTKQKDFETARVFLDRLLGIEDRIAKVIEQTNPLCYKTIHTPQLDINEAMRKLLDQAVVMKEKLPAN